MFKLLVFSDFKRYTRSLKSKQLTPQLRLITPNFSLGLVNYIPKIEEILENDCSIPIAVQNQKCSHKDCKKNGTPSRKPPRQEVNTFHRVWSLNGSCLQFFCSYFLFSSGFCQTLTSLKFSSIIHRDFRTRTTNRFYIPNPYQLNWNH